MSHFFGNAQKHSYIIGKNLSITGRGQLVSPSTDDSLFFGASDMLLAILKVPHKVILKMEDPSTLKIFNIDLAYTVG